MEPLETQKELLEITIELQRLDQRLHELAATLPRPAHQDHMLEGDIPSDVATEIHGAITTGQYDQLRPLIAGLGAASTVTADDLRARFFRRDVRRMREARDVKAVPPVPENPESDDQAGAAASTAEGG